MQTQQELLQLREHARITHGADSPEYRSIQAKITYLLNPDKAKATTKRWRKEHRVEANAYGRAYSKHRRLTDPDYRLKNNAISNAYYKSHKQQFLEYSKKRRNSKQRINAERTLAMLRHWLKSPRFPNFSPSYKPRSLFKVIGCSGKDFKTHIESFFTSDMNWKNHGSVWHFSHKIPIRNFDCSDLKQLYKCFHYTNLMPDTVYNNMRRLNEVTVHTV